MASQPPVMPHLTLQLPTASQAILDLPKAKVQPGHSPALSPSVVPSCPSPTARHPSWNLLPPPLPLTDDSSPAFPGVHGQPASHQPPPCPPSCTPSLQPPLRPFPFLHPVCSPNLTWISGPRGSDASHHLPSPSIRSVGTRHCPCDDVALLHWPGSLCPSTPLTPEHSLQSTFT